MNPWRPYFHDVIVPQRPYVLVLYHQTSSWRQNFNLCQNFENDKKSQLIGTRYVKNRVFSKTITSSNMKKAKMEVRKDPEEKESKALFCVSIIFAMVFTF